MTRTAPVGPITARLFKAPTIAVTIATSAPRQTQTLVPSISSSITCGRAATDLLSDNDGTGGDDASSRASTTTGAKGAPPDNAAFLRASRRQENSCCGVSPRRRATSETTAPGAKRFFHRLRLLVIRPTTTALAAARDHFDPPNSVALRLKRMIKSGHKPYLRQEMRLAAFSVRWKVGP